MKWVWQRKEDELNAEIQHHLDEATREWMARGETPEQARLNARREFSNVGLVKEVTRAMWGWASLERLMQEDAAGRRKITYYPVAVDRLSVPQFALDQTLMQKRSDCVAQFSVQRSSSNARR